MIDVGFAEMLTQIPLNLLLPIRPVFLQFGKLIVTSHRPVPYLVNTL